MKKKTATEIFSVDPNLTIVSHRSSARNWEAAGGAHCLRCGQEATRFRPEDGACLSCAQELNELEDKEKKKRDKILKYVKAHNARVKGKGAH